MPRNPNPNGPRPGVFVDRFEALLGALPSSRTLFANWLRTAGLDDEVAGDLEVVFSELTANAVAGSPDTSDDVDVHARIDDDTLVLDVSNHISDPDQLPPAAPDVADPLRRNGRGLLITRAFMDTVDVHIEHLDRLVVHCRRRILPVS